MKNLKISLASFFVLFISANLFTACSVDNEMTEKEPINETLDSFLESNYPNAKNYKTGIEINVPINKSNEAERTTFENDEFIITEVFVGDELRARRYNIRNRDTGEFLYFIDIDREEYILTLSDISNDEEITFYNINENENYLRTNEFDFIEIAEDYGNQTEGKFWGWEQWNGPCDEETGESILMETYYVVGIGVKTRKVVGLDGGDVIQPCAGGALLD